MSDKPVDVLVLGPVGLRRDGEFLSPPSGVSRAILAALALAGPDGLTSSALFQTVWASRSANAERSTVTVSIHRVRQWLREAVGDAVRLERSGAAYVLRASGYSDVARFRQLMADGRPAEALELWRGKPLADVPSESQDPIAVSVLTHDCVNAAMESSRDLVDKGDAERAVRLLRPLVEEHPLDEPLQASWMQALAATGRQAEALDAYERVRHRLRTELGVDPGKALTECLVKILRAESPTATKAQPAYVKPAQLPAAVAGFTGRSEQFSALDAFWRDSAPGVSPLMVVCGQGGVGKTSLVVQWAHRIAHEFPDGQLFIDLRGYSREAPVPVIEALHRFIRALGRAPDEIPADRDEAAALYRSLLANRRVLIVLDNALSPDQIRHLLPGADVCAVVVTSRDRLDGLLIRDGSQRLDLDVLSPAEAESLLELTIGTDRIGGDRNSLSTLAQQCGFLPLALRVASAQLRGGPRMAIASYVAQMAALGPLNTLQVPGDDDTAVSAAFDLSYLRLAPDDQRCFRLLAAVPGQDVSMEAVAELVDISPVNAASSLQALAAAHLVSEHVSGRFSIHDLLKAHARLHLERMETKGEIGAAVRRLANWYLSGATVAAGILYAMTLLPAQGDPRRRRQLRLVDAGSAADWLQTEASNIVTLIRSSNQIGIERVWLLVDALRGYFAYHRLVPEWESTTKIGLPAAVAANDLAGQAAMLNSRGGLSFYARQEMTKAAADFGRAEILARQAGWKGGEKTALLSLALIDDWTGNANAAIRRLARAVYVGRQGRDRVPELSTRNNLAHSYIHQGRVRQALSQLNWAIIHSAESEMYHKQVLLSCRTDVYRYLGKFGRALSDITAAVDASRLASSRFQEARSLAVLSLLYSQYDRPAAALQAAKASIDIAERLQDGGLVDYCNFALGETYSVMSDPARAAAHYARVLDRSQEAVEFIVRVSALLGMATVERDPTLVRKTLELLRGKGYRVMEGQAYGILAEIYRDNDAAETAIGFAEDALRFFRRTDYRMGDAKSFGILADAHQLMGNEVSAVECAATAENIYRGLKLPANVLSPGWIRG